MYRKSTRLTIILSIAAIAFFISAGNGFSKDWPSKTISLIYHSKAGSGGDMFLRALAKAMEPDLGESIIVVNKPGAAAMNAWKAATRAKDGHTFLGVSSTMITSPILNDLRNLKYIYIFRNISTTNSCLLQHPQI